MPFVLPTLNSEEPNIYYMEKLKKVIAIRFSWDGNSLVSAYMIIDLEKISFLAKMVFLLFTISSIIIFVN